MTALAAAAAPDPQHVAAVRRFNRFYTQRLGVLAPDWLDSEFSLSEARVLYEIKAREGATATEIGRALDLDAGYLSRILRGFEKRGLVRKTVSPADGRQSHLAITARGRKAFAPLEQRTLAQVGALLGRLSAAEQEHLVSAMASIESMMDAQSPTEPSLRARAERGRSNPEPQTPIILRPPRPGDLGWVVARHAELYRQEYGWAHEFEGICARIVADFAAAAEPERERCWIAEMDGRNVGSVFLVRESDTIARLRLLLVDPSARGRGLGTRLTQECIAFARSRGYRSITLWTHQVLTAARLVYQRAGFRLTSSEPRKSFGQDVVAEFWDLDL